VKTILANEIKLQWRQGFWLVYFIVTALYILVLLNLPAENRKLVSLLMILSDTTMLGVIFIGALVLLEKQQRVTQSLFVTPLSPESYILSKTLSLSLIAVCMSILVYLPTGTADGYTPVLLLTVACTAWIFSILGLGLAAGVNSINAYFGTLMGVSVLILVPVVPYLLLDRPVAFLWLPYVASLDLMMGALEPLPGWRLLLDGVFLLSWGCLAFVYCLNRVNKKLVSG